MRVLIAIFVVVIAVNVFGVVLSRSHNIWETKCREECAARYGTTQVKVDRKEDEIGSYCECFLRQGGVIRIQEK
jgi:hypothetical protein